MGFVSTLIGNLRGLTLDDPANWPVEFLRGGSAVSPDSAMQIGAVLACVRVVAESVMMLPLEVRAREGRGTRRATELPIYGLLHDLPNPEMTSADLRMTLQGHLTTWGNGYAQKVPDRAGRWMELWPLAPNRMTVKRAPDESLVYEYREASGELRTFPQREIMHVRGLSFDGLMGYSPVALARRTFERKLSMERFESAFWDNGAQPGSVLKHPGTLSDKAYARLLEAWEKRHMGPQNANRVAILEEGLDVASIGIPQSDAQFLESQKLTRTEIAALFRVPPHMAGDLDRATWSNVEQMGLEFVIYALMPWLVLWEQAIGRDLMTAQERTRYYAKHKLQGLLRGDNASRSQFYAAGLQWGWFSINDVRELEDMNPVANGDTYFVPLNMAPLDQAVLGVSAVSSAPVRAFEQCDHGEGCGCGREHPQGDAPTERRAEDDAVEELRLTRVEMARAMEPVLEDVARRLTGREVRDVRRLVEKHLRKRADDEFLAAVTALYNEFGGVVADAFRAALLAYARQAMLAASAELGVTSPGLTDELRQFVSEYLENLGNGWAASSRTQIGIVLDAAVAAGDDPATAIEERLTRWEESKPGKVADRQAFEGLNAFVIAAYGIHQITRIRWAAAGTSCPFCRQLNGRVIGIEESFLEEGAELDGGEAGPMKVRHRVRSGRLHGGCDCVIVAERATEE